MERKLAPQEQLLSPSGASPQRPRFKRKMDGATVDGYHRFARFTVGATVLLLLAGALVTTTGSGLSVPDWPLSFGTFFPHMIGGVRFEHSHRLVAGTVATCMMVLGVWVMRREPRAWVRCLAGFGMAAVFLQALLGGLTVLLRLPPAVSIAHATLGQTFFCVTVALAMVTSPAWKSALPLAAAPTDGRLRALALVTTVAAWCQLVLGAWMRHLHAALVIPDFPLVNGGLLPPTWTWAVTANYAHRCGALVVLLLSVATWYTAWRYYRDEEFLRRPAARLLHLVAFQILLGAVTIWSGRSWTVATLHVVNGALVLASSLAVTLWAYRLLRLSPDQVAPLLPDRVVRG